MHVATGLKSSAQILKSGYNYVDLNLSWVEPFVERWSRVMPGIYARIA